MKKTIMSKIDFSDLNKQTSDSFHAQRNLLKKVFKGEQVPCQHCQQSLALIPAQDGVAFVSCNKGCTKIELELD